jgi:hypothetical protein
MFVAAIAPSACAPQDVVVATVASDAATDDAAMQDEPPPGDGTCATNADCGETSFCAKSACKDATGSCQLRPVECNGDDQRYCGCDGVTYWNECLRQQYGVAASTMGECRVGAAMCQPEGPSSCPVIGASCERLLTQGEMCGGNVPGVCWVVPLVPTTCTGPGGGPPSLWMACAGPPMCVDTCTAIQSGEPYHPTSPTACPGG